jgi:peptidoglycan/LPS O-acetylase OafA/YrhL
LDSLAGLLYFANWLRAFGRDLGILGHLWSLSIEEQFYLLWPIALVFLLSLRISLNYIAAITAFAVVAVNVDRIFLYRGMESLNRIYNGLDTHADPLLIGCTLGLIGYKFLSRGAFAVLGLIGAAFVGHILFRSYPVPAQFVVPFGLTIGGTVFAIAIMLALAGILANPESIFAKLLRLRPLVWTGRISYGLYLWHFPLFTLIDTSFPTLRPIFLIPFKVAATFLCATLSYYLVEQPCLRLKKKFSVIKTAVPAPPASAQVAGY